MCVYVSLVHIIICQPHAGHVHFFKLFHLDMKSYLFVDVVVHQYNTIPRLIEVRRRGGGGQEMRWHRQRSVDQPETAKGRSMIQCPRIGKFGWERHPNTNNIPPSFPILKDSFPLDPRCNGWWSVRIFVTFFQFSSLNCSHIDDK